MTEKDAPTVAKKKTSKKKILFWLIGIFIALSVISAIQGGNSKKDSTSGAKTSDTPTKAAGVAGLNTAVRDGKFEFNVSKIECGATSVGTNQYLQKKAQGQFCLITVSVKNIGNEAQSLFADNQYLYNASSQKYSADSTATMYATPDTSAWYSNINPGNTVQGQVVFDIPVGQTPVKAELHDSAYSSGVKVNLQ